MEILPLTTQKEKQETPHNIRLTSAELGSLWAQYLSDSMVVCTLSYFLNKVEDTEIKPIVEYALSLSQKHIQTITDIFHHEKHPIPIGFTKNDVNVDAPRLFSDSFILAYLQHMSILSMAASSIAFGMTARSDVSDLFRESLASAAELHHSAKKGAATAASARRDLGVHYARLIQEIIQYAEDGANLLIENGWIEEPPQADNRQKLIQSKMAIQFLSSS